MDQYIPITDSIYYIGVNDRDTYLFENIWPLPKGKKIDYLVINHMEPDHSGAIIEIIEEFPDIKLVGNKKTFEMLKALFGVER